MHFNRYVRRIIYPRKGFAFTLLSVFVVLIFITNYYHQPTKNRRRKSNEWQTSVGYTLASKQDGLAQTPPMGWNSWNYFRCEDLNEEVIHQAVHQLVKTGLRDAGYVYVNIDDCWQKDRDASTGRIIEDRSKFPQGMNALGRFIHDHGLKFGIYTDIGEKTCEGRPGSFSNELMDIATYADWEVDFIKNDDCHIPQGGGMRDYQIFWQHLQGSDRPMIHSVKGYPHVLPQEGSEISHMRRVGWDIYDNWGAVLALANNVIDEELWRFSGPGYWNDLDMLEIGNGGLTENENIAHMILWCAFKSPLLMGNNLGNLDAFLIDLLGHDELLAVNQDSLGVSVSLAAALHPPTGQGWRRVVTRDCDRNNQAQAWIYERRGGSGLIKNLKTGKCLAAMVEQDMAAIVKDCNWQDRYQKWVINYETKKIVLAEQPEYCLTIGTNYNIQAKVPRCKDRQLHPWYKGPNKAYYPWNDDFDVTVTEFHLFSPSVFHISNPAITAPDVFHCLHVGDRKEVEIFTGPLSGNRYIAVLLNRDDVKHKVTLKWKHLPPEAGTRGLTMRDVYRRQDIGDFTLEHTFDVQPHYAIMLVLQ